MNLRRARTVTANSLEGHNAADMHLRGRRLVLAQVALGVLAVFALLVSFFLTLLVPSLNQSGSLYQLLFNIDTGISPLNFLLPLCFGIAILRYRLWDIDVLINRKLVYGTLTVLLTGVYISLIIGLSALLRGLINQGSGLAIVLSTLAIYVLFQPLRRRLQAIIDRRFYRSKYDAAKTMAAFSATLRQEVDLDQLRKQLLAVVQETMQPAHVFLWLRPPEREETRRAPWRVTAPVSSEGK